MAINRFLEFLGSQNELRKKRDGRIEYKWWWKYSPSQYLRMLGSSIAYQVFRGANSLENFFL